MAFTTKKSLLLRVKNGDEISYAEFYQSYRPLIWLVGGDCLLTNEEKQDLIQEVMLAIFGKDGKLEHGALFKYDDAKGRFRDYFKGIVRNLASNIKSKRGNCVDMEVEKMPDTMCDDDFDQIWEEEWRKSIFQQAMDELRNRVRSSTFAAFDMYAVQGRPVEEVANILEMSINAVYIAKNRCVEELKAIISCLEAK